MSQPERPPVVWWVRRDLRLHDNRAIAAALAAAETVIPLFVLDPHILNSATHRDAHRRQAFLFGGLGQLAADLRALGSRLIIRSGPPLDVLAALLAETKAAAIFATEDYSPYARRRDSLVARRLPLSLLDGLTVLHPSAVVKADGSPYTVFTPFSRRWKTLSASGAGALVRAPTRLSPPPEVDSEALPPAPAALPFAPGEAPALEALRAFTRSRRAPIYNYAAGRNRLDEAGTSTLSPYLRFGMLSAREAAAAARQAIESAPNAQARRGAEAWLNELIWREFYCAILFHFPHVLRHAFRPQWRHVAWLNDEGAFAAWRQGQTGYPVVDAAMRQLAETGWMHNRARMIVASFLVKDLLIDWRWGEQWFMQQLIDGDPAANNGGWQWTAGVGTDAAPYFRVFNPILQSRKFDPQGNFARAWIPELRRVPDKYIHEPWKMPDAVQAEAGCRVGLDYPSPLIDHAFARRRALDAYRASEPA